MRLLSFLLYRFLYATLLFVVRPLRFTFSSKLKSYFEDRVHHRPLQLPARPILIHAASGEIEYAKPLIRKLREEYPQVPLLVTYTSPSIKKLVSDIQVDGISPLPFDRPQACLRFLKQVQPRMVLFSRTDVWPEFAYQCKKMKIPIVLFSATFSLKSLRLKFPFSLWTSFALDQVNLISCVDKTDLELLEKLRPQAESVVGGDTRIDQVLYRLASPRFTERIFPETPRQDVFVIGSSWPEDEEQLFSPAFDWVRLGRKIIWAPHEITAEHLETIRIAFKDQGLQVQKWSEIKAGSPLHASVILFDQIGALADLYKQGTVAFIGGSFRKRVHSVMEALAQDCWVLTGPLIENNREAVNFAALSFETDLTMVKVCHNSDEISVCLARANEIRTAGRIRSQIESLAGATETLFKRLRQWLGTDIP